MYGANMKIAILNAERSPSITICRQICK